MPHGRHIYAKTYDTTKAIMCTYPQSDHALPHWKCVLRCCAECPCINLHDQKTNKKHEETTPSIQFHIYNIIVRCSAHGIITLKEKKICHMCRQESSSDEYKNIHQKRASDDGDNYFRFSYQFLY